MKKPSEIDVLARMVWFEDTPEMVEKLKGLGLPEYARHLHKLNIYNKKLVAEIRKLRREAK